MDLVPKEEEILDAVIFCGVEVARSRDDIRLRRRMTVSKGSSFVASFFLGRYAAQYLLTGNSSEGRASGSSVSSHGRPGRPPLPPPRPPRPPPRPPPLDISDSARVSCAKLQLLSERVYSGASS